MTFFKKYFLLKIVVLATGLLFFYSFSDAAPGDSLTMRNGDPVILRNDTLFYLHAGHQLMTLDERVQLVEQRLNNLATLPDFVADSLTIGNDSAFSLILYKGSLVMAVNDSDALFSDASRQELANEYKDVIGKTVTSYSERLNVHFIIKIIWQALALIIVVVLLIYAVNKLFRWIRYKLLVQQKFGEIKIRDYSLITAERLKMILDRGMRILRLVLILIVLYISLPVLFSIFPWTRPIADRLFGYIIGPLRSFVLGIIHYLPNLLSIIIIYIVTRYIIKGVRFFAKEIERGALKIKNFYPDWAIPTYNIVKGFLYIFMFIVIYPYLPGSQSKVFQGVSVFLGVLFSLGSTSAIANIVAGVVLTYMRPFKIGDRVKIGDTIGDVIEKTMLVTRIKTIKNEETTVPNSAVLSGHTLNYSAFASTDGLLLYTSVTIGYDAPWPQVHELLISAAKATPGVLQDPAPFVLQTSLDDFYVSYQINAYTRLPNQMVQIYSALHEQIQNKFFEAGVEIMSSHYSSIRDGNTVAIPKQYRPEDYKKPGFKVEKDE
jgi:small-conductance mechanosensitive channel